MRQAVGKRAGSNGKARAGSRGEGSECGGDGSDGEAWEAARRRVRDAWEGRQEAWRVPREAWEASGEAWDAGEEVWAAGGGGRTV